MRGYRAITPLISSCLSFRYGYAHSAAFIQNILLYNQITNPSMTFMSSCSSSSNEFSANAASTKTLVQGPPLPPVSPMSKRIFWVRHGEVINPGGDKDVFYGSMDVSLSSFGELEAKAAADYLRQHELQYIAASPLSRAVYGATQILSSQSSVMSDLKIFQGFMELNRGAWCGMTKDEIGVDMLARFDACDETVTPTGGESYPQLKARVLDARNKLLEITDCGKASAVVSHLQVTRSIVSDALGIPTHEMTRLKVATASITCIDYDSVTGSQTVHFQSFKPDVGLRQSKDGAN